MPRKLALLVSSLVVLTVGCDSGETGYIQLRVQPASAAPAIALYLDGGRLDFSRGPITTLQFKTGRLALKEVDSTWSAPLCKIVVRKDRISTVTIVGTQTPPKCLCEIRGADSTANDLVCA